MRELDWRIILGVALVLAIPLVLVVLNAEQVFGMAFVGGVLLLALVCSLVLAAMLAYPIVYVICVIVYAFREEEKAPGIYYSIDQGKESGGGSSRDETDA